MILSVLAISAGTVNVSAQEANKVKAEFKSEAIFPAIALHVHSSSVVELGNGDLLCCWYQGSGEREADNVVIMGSRLKKGAPGWSEPFILADTPEFPDLNPVLFIDPLHSLHLVWIATLAGRWENSLLRTRISVDYLNSGPPVWSWQDDIILKPGKEFQETITRQFNEIKYPDVVTASYAPRYEQMIAAAAGDPAKRQTGWMTRVQPLLLPDGKLLLPLYSDGFSLSLVAVSEDGGNTWKACRPIVGRGNIQPALIRKKDGTIVAFMRDNGDFPGRIMLSESTDEGYSWSYARKSGIPNPGSSVYAIALCNGDWIMAYNDLEEDRYRLAVSLSDDEGRTWKWTRYLEEKNMGEGSFSYPTIIQGRDGLIHVTYSWSVKQHETIMHSAFSEEWIKEKLTQGRSGEGTERH